MFACAAETEETSLAGLWQGLVDFDDQEIRVELELAENDEGDLNGALHLADFGLLNLPLDEATREGTRVTVSAGFGLAFDGELRPGGRALEGLFATRETDPTPLRLERDNPAFRRFEVPRLAASGETERAYTYEPPRRLDDGWSVSTLGAESIDAGQVEAVVSAVLAEQHGHAEAMLIVRHGNLVLEEYFHGFTADRLHSIQSVTKSVTSLLFGIAMDRGQIESLEQRVYAFFPQHQGRRWIDEKYDITLWHLLTMSAAIDWNERVPYSSPENSNTAMNASPEWIGYVLDRAPAGPPGELSSYTSGLSILLGGVLGRVTGKYVDELAEESLFADLGISRYRWFRAPDGTRHTGGGLNLTARDLAKLGQLVLNGGEWNGRRVVSEEWIARSTERHLPLAQAPSDPSRGYGFQWWHMSYGVGEREVRAVAGLGYGGQYLGIFPSLDVVIVLNAGEYLDPDQRRFDITAIVESGLLPAIE